MGLLGVIGSVLGTHKRLVTLDGEPARGEAAPAVRMLVSRLRTDLEPELRSITQEPYLEVVITRARLDDCVRILTEALGEPAKPFGERARFAGPLAAMVTSRGGVEKNQSLHLRGFSDRRVAFAALWPWTEADRITLKVGVYAGALPASASASASASAP